MIIRSRIFFIFEQIKVIYRLYRASYRFAIVDLTLSIFYLFQNPYRICRKHFQKAGETNIHAYGETPLTVWAKIVEMAELQKTDRLIDLGCGRGRLSFWTRICIGCSVVGVDWVDLFVSKANRLARLFQISHIHFSCKKITQIDLKDASVVYLYTYHLDEDVLDFQNLPSKARVITVSEPLIRDGFILKKSLPVSFPWGKTNVFINEKI